MTEDHIRELLKEMRNEPVRADSLARVRLAVSEQRASESWFRRQGKRWLIPVGILVPACLALVLFLDRPVVRVARPPVVAELPTESPVPELSATVVARRMRSAGNTRLRARQKIADIDVRGREPVIRIETDDPDVVILFVE